MSYQSEIQLLLNKYPQIKRIRVEMEEVIERGVQIAQSVPEKKIVAVQPVVLDEKKSFDPEKAAQIKKTLAALNPVQVDTFQPVEVIKPFPTK